MIGDIKPTTIYINGVPISGVKEINLEPAHPTGDADMYKKQVVEWRHDGDDRLATILRNIDPEPKKVYLTTRNPYMSNDWKTELWKKIYSEFNLPEWVAVQDAKKYQDEMDAMRYCFNELNPLVKEESMNIVIYRSTFARAMEVSRYFKERLKEHPYGQNVVMTSAGLRFSGITNALRLWICYGDCDKMIGLRADYFSSDNAEATEYLRQRISGRGDITSHGLYKLWTIISKYLNEQYAPKDEDTYDWMAHSCKEIMADMGTILHRRQIAEKDFKSKEWVWEISSDVWQRLKEKPEFITNCYSAALPKKIYCIDVRVTNLKTNYIKLVKKEKENAMDKLYTTKNGILELNGVRYPVRINEVGQGFNEPTHVNLYITGEGNSNYLIMPRHAGYSEAMKWRQFTSEMLCGVDLNHSIPAIKEVKFEEPATIVFWEDGTKTVVRAQGEDYDPEKGLAMAISRKALGNRRDYYHVFLRWLKKFRKKPDTVKLYVDDHAVMEFPANTLDK